MDYKLPKLPYRDENSNKGSFGKILNISGSKYMTGAACLSSLAALKIGVGYVEIASCDEVLKAAACYSPEIVLAPTEKIRDLLIKQQYFSSDADCQQLIVQKKYLPKLLNNEGIFLQSLMLTDLTFYQKQNIHLMEE